MKKNGLEEKFIDCIMRDQNISREEALPQARKTMEALKKSFRKPLKQRISRYIHATARKLAYKWFGICEHDEIETEFIYSDCKEVLYGPDRANRLFGNRLFRINTKCSRCGKLTINCLNPVWRDAVWKLNWDSIYEKDSWTLLPKAKDWKKTIEAEKKEISINKDE